jgi:hypothetical protein
MEAAWSFELRILAFELLDLDAQYRRHGLGFNSIDGYQVVSHNHVTLLERMHLATTSSSRTGCPSH